MFLCALKSFLIFYIFTSKLYVLRNFFYFLIKQLIIYFQPNQFLFFPLNIFLSINKLFFLAFYDTIPFCFFYFTILQDFSEEIRNYFSPFLYKYLMKFSSTWKRKSWSGNFTLSQPFIEFIIFITHFHYKRNTYILVD